MGSGRKVKGTRKRASRQLRANALSPGELDTNDDYYYKWFTAGRFLATALRDFPATRTALQMCPLTKATILSSLRKPSVKLVHWIREWAHERGIESSYVMAIAAQSLAYWKKAGGNGVLNVRWALGVDPVNVRVPSLKRFDPMMETRAEWLRRVRIWTKDVLEQYSRHGCKKARVKNDRRHYQWLARRTVGRESVTTIARDVKRAMTGSNDNDPGNFRQMVDTAIHTIATAIDLPLK